METVIFTFKNIVVPCIFILHFLKHGTPFLCISSTNIGWKSWLALKRAVFVDLVIFTGGKCRRGSLVVASWGTGTGASGCGLQSQSRSADRSSTSYTACSGSDPHPGVRKEVELHHRSHKTPFFFLFFFLSAPENRNDKNGPVLIFIRKRKMIWLVNTTQSDWLTSHKQNDVIWLVNAKMRQEIWLVKHHINKMLSYDWSM